MTSELKISGQALPQGFQWGAVKAGIKASGNLDVAVTCEQGSECSRDVHEKPSRSRTSDSGAQASDLD